jgi:hypothetical protein
MPLQIGATLQVVAYSSEIAETPWSNTTHSKPFGDPSLLSQFRENQPAEESISLLDSRSCSLSALKLPRVLAQYDKQLSEACFVVVAQAGGSVCIDPLGMLSLQGFTNSHSKFLVGMDFPQHCWDALQRLGSGGCFYVGFCGSVRQRISEPVLGTSLDDVRCARRPRRVKTQASRADFEPANAPSFDA